MSHWKEVLRTVQFAESLLQFSDQDQLYTPML